MEQFQEVSTLMEKILKNLKNPTLDWTYQQSISSVHPNKITYAVQLEAPANGLQPVTWICDSHEELVKELKISVKGLKPEAVEKAWHESEIQRAEALMNYHKQALETSK